MRTAHEGAGPTLGSTRCSAPPDRLPPDKIKGAHIAPTCADFRGAETEKPQATGLRSRSCHRFRETVALCPELRGRESLGYLPAVTDKRQGLPTVPNQRGADSGAHADHTGAGLTLWVP